MWYTDPDNIRRRAFPPERMEFTMFNRAELKQNAKMRIRSGIGKAILVFLIAGLLCGTLSLRLDVSDIFSVHTENPGDMIMQDGEWIQIRGDDLDIRSFDDLREWLTEEIDSRFGDVFAGFTWEELLLVAGIALLIFLLFGAAYRILFAAVVQVGQSGWFLRYHRGETPGVGELFAAFRFYVPSLLTSLLRKVYTFLWSLLFIIPGIVKGYAYSMTDYILYENPNLSANDAITMSRKMTDGAKFDLFVFDLSYIGWNLLNGLTFGILEIVYTGPYKATAHAAIYDVLKFSAIRRGVLTWEDFGQMPPVFAPADPWAEQYPEQPDVQQPNDGFFPPTVSQ